MLRYPYCNRRRCQKMQQETNTSIEILVELAIADAVFETGGDKHTSYRFRPTCCGKPPAHHVTSGEQALWLLLLSDETCQAWLSCHVGEETAEEANVIMRRPCFVCQSTRLLYAVVLILTRCQSVQAGDDVPFSWDATIPNVMKWI